MTDFAEDILPFETRASVRASERANHRPVSGIGAMLKAELRNARRAAQCMEVVLYAGCDWLRRILLALATCFILSVTGRSLRSHPSRGVFTMFFKIQGHCLFSCVFVGELNSWRYVQFYIWLRFILQCHRTESQPPGIQPL